MTMFLLTVGAAALQVYNTTSNFAVVPADGGLILLVATFVMLLALAVGFVWYLLSTLERFKKIGKIVAGFADVVVSAVVGAITIAVLLGLYWVFSTGATAAATAVDPMLYVIAAVGFVASALIGYAVRYAFKWAAGRVESHTKAIEAEAAAQAQAAVQTP